MFTITPIKGYIDSIDGFYCDGISAGLKSKNKLDLGFIYSDTLCKSASLFTQNRFQAAPLVHFLRYPKNFKTNFVLINSKNANAMTGKKGIDDIDWVFKNMNLKNIINPIMSSTGVIGVQLPKEKILDGVLNFDLYKKNGKNLSEAIMTTDSYAKSSLYEVTLSNNRSFRIGAVAKGAGMINPNMATMLCFICTDANVPIEDMNECLNEINYNTFNAISVDGDTSTNDTVLLLANDKSDCYDKDAFKEALKIVMEEIALMIVGDGEGAKKVCAFEVSGALNNSEAESIAKKLSNSLLVKTALFGEDPNWGRIASTIGSSGSSCDSETLSISFGNIKVYDKGVINFTKEIETEASKVLQKDQFIIKCDLGLGEGKFTSYGCDLGYEYVKINADYRT